MNASDKKTMKQVYTLVKELTPITNALKDITNERLELIKLLKQIEPYVDEVEEIWNTEQDKYERRSETWQESEVGEQSRHLASCLETIHSNLEDCLYYLNELQ